MPITVTYNGKPFDPEEWRKDITRLVIEKAKAHYEEKIKSLLTDEELAQVTLDFTDDESGNPKISIKGPQEIVDKITKELSQG